MFVLHMTKCADCSVEAHFIPTQDARGYNVDPTSKVRVADNPLCAIFSCLDQYLPKYAQAPSKMRTLASASHL